MIANNGSQAPGVKLHPEMVFDLTARPGLQKLLKEVVLPGVKLACGLLPHPPCFLLLLLWGYRVSPAVSAHPFMSTVPP